MAFKNNCPCYDKAKENEPIFVLRGQDMSSPLVVLDWIKFNLHTVGKEKLQEAFNCVLQMKDYPFTKAAD